MLANTNGDFRTLSQSFSLFLWHWINISSLRNHAINSHPNIELSSFAAQCVWTLITELCMFFFSIEITNVFVFSARKFNRGGEESVSVFPAATMWSALASFVCSVFYDCK